MKRTFNIFRSCLVLVGLVLMIGAAGMSDTCTGSMEGLIFNTYGVCTISSQPADRVTICCWISTPMVSIFTASSNSSITIL